MLSSGLCSLLLRWPIIKGRNQMKGHPFIDVLTSIRFSTPLANRHFDRLSAGSGTRIRTMILPRRRSAREQPRAAAYRRANVRIWYWIGSCMSESGTNETRSQLTYRICHFLIYTVTFVSNGTYLSNVEQRFSPFQKRSHEIPEQTIKHVFEERRFNGA